MPLKSSRYLITFSIAFEAISRSLMSFVPRYTASAVRRTRAPASTIRVANESATNKLFIIFWLNEEEELREANSIDLKDWFHLHKLIILLIYSYKGRSKMGTWIDISDRLTKTDLTKLYISQTEQSDRLWTVNRFKIRQKASLSIRQILWSERRQSWTK